MEEIIHIYKLTYKERPVRHPQEKPKVLEWLCMCRPSQIEFKKGDRNYIFKGENLEIDYYSMESKLNYGLLKRTSLLSFKVPSQLPDYIEIPNTDEKHRIVLRENLEKPERDNFIRILKGF